MEKTESGIVIGSMTEVEAMTFALESGVDLESDSDLFADYFDIEAPRMKKMYSMIRGYQICERPNGLGSMQTTLDAVKPRLENTLRRLKSKGIYQGNAFALLDSITDEESFPAWLWFLCGQYKYRQSGDAPDAISDGTWYIAIEEIVRKYNPDMLGDPDCTNYFYLLKGHETELQLTAFAIYCMDIERFTKEEMAREEAAAASDASMQRSLRKLQKRCDKAIAETQRFATECDALRAQISELKKQLSDEKLSHNKDLLRIEHDQEDERDAWEEERARLLRHIARLENPNRDDNANVKNGEGEDIDGDVIALEDSDDDTSDIDNVTLPESGVVFLGGHVSVIQKVKALHPDWTFFNLSEYRAPNFPQDTKVVFYQYEHISHKAGRMFFARVGRNIPLVYLKTTNIPQMERDMKRGYAKITK